MVSTKFSFGGASDPGRVRRNNEDAFHLDQARGIFLVVDGIGGHAAGEKAAAIAVERVRARLERATGSTEQRIREAIALANNEILRAARSNTEWKGMACVLTLVVIEEGTAVVGHVGDSRLYQIRAGTIRKVTHDHSPVGEREDSQELSEAEAMRHPRRNEVYRDVGSEEHSPDDADFVEVQRIPFDETCALVLCSDGLSDQVPSAEIRAAVERHAADPDAAVRDLIARANAAGGKDNVTAVVITGSDFSASPAVAAKPPNTAPAIWKYAAVGVTAAVLALAVVWFTRSLWMPTPPPPPRVIAVRGSIAAAMAEARPGDTVQVPPGEYREQIVLKSGVTLRASSPRDSTLRAAPVGSGPAVIAEHVRGARFSGFRILANREMPLPVGIQLHDSEVEIDDVEISGAGVGIEIRGPGGPVLRSNSVRDCLAEGILILGGATPWLSHNVIQNNKGAGISAREGARPALLENIIDRNAIDVPGDAIPIREHNFILDPRGRK